MFSGLKIILRRLVPTGNLTVIDAEGNAQTFGDGTGEPIAVRFADRATERAIAIDPNLVLGEAYMDGRIELVQGSIYDLLALVMKGAEQFRLPQWTRGLDLVRHGLRRVTQFNPSGRSRRNVSHHYDIDSSIYDLFLDADRQYSCGYFTDGANLSEAQLAKKRHIAAKLALEPGQTVLDIGCGWGGLALYLARMFDVEVTGITLSTEQLEVAKTRAKTERLSESVRFELEDYRKVSRRYDRIVSVGMFEHVGVNHYGTYFEKIAHLLAEDGVALVHSIGRSDGPGFTNPFISRYIFPGGYFPALSEVLPAVERAGLIVADVEILRLHYAETLKAWREAFLARREEAVALKGEAFARMWEFYLAGSEAGFRHQGLVVFQLQLARRIDALPITRDYMAAVERRLMARDAGDRRPQPQRMAGE
jgi:cyclopropane-fatty-acyl-phospholipid synthase